MLDLFLEQFDPSLHTYKGIVLSEE